ncbi:MAG: hypothetical protein FWD52_09415 [Candidatus Bathyarchaeota archaeon]|nr:hypothetical protein [Candidatus Termiticorpusculum sp.]
MKPSTVILYVAVALSLVFSLTALIIVAQNNDIFTSNPPPLTPTTPTYTAPTHTTPTTTPPETVLAITYTETNRAENKGITKVTLTVDVTYKIGDPVTINYSEFYLRLYTGRNIFAWEVGTTTPKNSGSFTLGPSHKTQTFQLNFEFSTTCFNGMDYDCTTLYQLKYNGPATAQWAKE